MKNLFYNISGFIKKPACAIIALLFIGCAGAGIKPNKDVMKSFEGSPKANHSYFLSGTANSPEGIIGIDNAYITYGTFVQNVHKIKHGCFLIIHFDVSFFTPIPQTNLSLTL